MVRTALLVSEIGGGEGHLGRITRIAETLVLRGYDVSVATKGKVSHRLAGLAKTVSLVIGHSELRQPDTAKILKPNMRNAMSYAGILYAAGFADRAIAMRRMAWWSALYASVKPDVVIADHAPMAVLAATGIIPTVIIGNGFHVPACLGSELSPDGKAPEVDDLKLQQKIFGTLNDALKKLRRPELDIAKALCGDMSCPATLPEMDPRHAIRAGALIPPEIDVIPDISQSRSGTVLAYMGHELREHWAALSAIVASGVAVTLYVPSESQGKLPAGEHAGLTIRTKPFAPSDFSNNASMILHHGGSGITHLAAYAGVPQFIVFWHNERRWNALSVANMGAGEGVPIKSSPDHIAALARKVSETPHYHDNARIWAEKSHQWAAGRRGQDVIAAKVDAYLHSRTYLSDIAQK